MKQIKKLVLLPVLLSLPLVFSLNCVGTQTDAEKGIRDQVLLVGNFSEPEDLDPHIVTGNVEFNVVMALLEGLVGQDPVDLHPAPGAARSWDATDGGRQYTFHLRSDGKWSNGDPVTAQDFVYSFKRILTPALASEYAYMLYCMKNAEAYHKGNITDFSQVGANALDDTTLQITLAEPTPYFLSLLQHVSWFPVHRPTIEKFNAFSLRGTSWTKPGNFVGNGPFTLDRWDMNKVITVKKNPNYWDAATVKLSAINFYPIESSQTEERSFRAGQLHLTYSVPLNRLEWYQKERPDLLHISPFLATYYYIFNVTRKPFDDPRVRRALAMAIDRDAIVKDILKGGQLPAHSFTPPNTAGYTCATSVPYDTAAARKLLAQAGYPNGAGFPAAQLLYNTSESHHTIAQAIQQMWKQNLNIDIGLINQEWKVYLATTHSLQYDIARHGWIGDYVDPNTFLDLWVTGGGNNRTGWSNTSYDSLITLARSEADSSRRLAVFQQAESILLEQMPIAPIYFYTNQALINPAVKGWYPTLLNQHPYKYLYLEQKK